MRFFLGFILFVLAGVESYAAPFSSPATPRRNPIFSVPSALKPRVEFWIDIFTKYGKHQIVVHHRNFPQATFMVLDFRAQAAKMSEQSLARYRKKRLKAAVAEVQKAMQHLAAGKAPATSLQRRIVQEMAFLGSGRSKYREVYKEKLVRGQTGIKEKFAEAIKRSGRYMHIIEDIFVREHGLPLELTRLPFVESSFDYKAYSSVGAAGIWQFMARTGRIYLRINNLVDERRDVVSSTRAAAKYLKDAYKTLKSWPLALTSYNHGVGGVRGKVRKMGTRDLVKIIEHPTKQAFGFASANFYPEFLAALEVYDHYRSYFPNVRPETPRYLAQRKLTRSIPVSSVVRQLGIDLEDLKSVNYAVASKVWKGYYNLPAGYTLKVPANYGTKLAQLRMPKASSNTLTVGSSSIYGGVVYKVRRGDTLSKIARKYRTTVSKLRAYNGLRSDLVKVGQLLVVRPRQTASGKSSSKSMIGVTNYRVQRGDTLSTIARRANTTVSALRSLNHLKSTRIKAGQVLKLRSTKASVSKSRGALTSTKSYKVRRGDTLSSIARRFGTSISALKRLNGLRSSKIKIGQTLKVSSSGSSKAVLLNQHYSVASGDSLWSISKRFGVSVSALKRANNLRSSRLRVGQKLVIP